MKRIPLLLALSLLFITPLSNWAQVKPLTADKPKLIVGIIVDQMRCDYLYRFKNKFGKDGLMRLMNEGFFCENTHYNYVPTYTAPGHACVYTGATPSVNGIVANEWFEREQNDTMYCVQDNAIQPVGSTTKAGMMSPRNLLTTTITDELRLSDNFKSKVIGISLKDRGAILPAGRSANAAYWYDGATGNWISSTWYMTDLPQWIKDFNALKLSDQYLSKPWTTLLPINQYTESTADDNIYEEPYPGEAKPVFPHDFPSIKGKDYELIRTSPTGNALTKDLAIAALKGENLGKGDYTDFLAVSFSATDYVGHQFGTNAIETEDTYLRLDKDIAELLTYIDNNYGKNNVLVFLTADHGASPNPAYMTEQKLAAGNFNMKAAMKKLNEELKNKYGEEQLVSCNMNDEVYLNHKLINEKKLDLEDVQKSVAATLLEVDGIANTITAADLNRSEFTQGINGSVQRGFYKKRSGDVMIVLESGQVEHKKQGTTHGSPYNYDTHVPLLFYGWNVPAGRTAMPVNTVDIAATLAAMLHIEQPSGCIGKPIEGLLK